MPKYTFFEKFYIKSFVGANEKEYFIDNLSMLISSGMTILEALYSMQKESKSKAFKKLLEKIISGIESGYSFSSVLTETELFSENLVSLVKIGEESGNLVKNLNIIALQERKNRDLRSKLKSASLYPVFVFCLMVIVSIGIAWFILPKLANVFDQLQLDLPLSTRILIGFGEFIQEYGSIVLPLFLVLFFSVIFFVFIFKKTRFIGQWILLHTPAIRNIVIDIEMARMSFLLGTLLSAGISINESINSVIQVTRYRIYKNLYQDILRDIEAGSPFKGIFKDNKKLNNYIPVSIQQMIIAGENSGNLPKVFSYISSVYEGRVDNSSKRLSTILEPVLLVVVWLGVLAVALSVILPIYSLVGGLN